MNSVENFNALNGQHVTRDYLLSIYAQAIEEKQTEVVERLSNTLVAYPDVEYFEMTIPKPAVFVNIALAGPKKKPKTKKQVVRVDNDIKQFLGYIEYRQETDKENKPASLGRVSPQDIYKMITDKLVKSFKEKDTPRYKQKWKSNVYGKGYLIPFNFLTKKRYRGINYAMLSSFEPLENPFFLSFKQVKKLGGTIKKGAIGNEIVYYTNLYKIVDKSRNLDFGSYELEKVKQFKEENKITSNITTIPIIKYYNVFNGKDIDGIDFDLDNFKIGFIDNPLKEGEKNAIAESVIDNYPKPQPKYKFGGDRAFYRPSADLIQMPHIIDFETPEDYYRTFMHELGHSTGSASRLKRDFSGKFGSKKYAQEELIAEWASVFLCAEAGIIWHNDSNHVAYMKSWNEALTHIKEDTKFLIKAASEAQKIADFVLQFDENGDPKYLQNMKVEKEASNKVERPVSKIKTEISQSEFIKSLKAKNYDDFKKRVEYLEGYLEIEKRLNIIENKNQAAIDVENDKLLRTYENEIDKLTKSLNIQVSQGAKYFNINYYDFIAAVNLFSEDKTAFKKAILSKETSIKKPVSKQKNKNSQLALFGNTNASIPEFSTRKEAKTFFKYWAKKHLSGKSIFHKELGKKVVFNMKGIEHAISSNLTIPKAALIMQAKEMLKKSVYISSEPDKKGRKEIVAIHRMQAEGYVNNELYKVILTLREGENGVIYYDHKIEELKKLSSTSTGLNKPTVQRSKKASSTKVQNKVTKKKPTIPKKLGTAVINILPVQAVEQQPQQVPVYKEPEAPQVDEVVENDVVVDETPEPKPKAKNKLMAMTFDSIEMDEGWEEFMQHPAANMKVAIYGKPKNGKTSGALKFAKYLSKKGSLLYNFADQGFNKSTQDLWRNSGLANVDNAEPSDISTLDALEAEIKRGKYKFVFIDMINDYINREGISPQDFKDRFIKGFPNTSFILIFEVTKGGDFKGDQGWTHIVDAIVTVEDFLMENRGRYGVGHHVIWKEGLQRFNPKKYDELYGEPLPATATI